MSRSLYVLRAAKWALSCFPPSIHSNLFYIQGLLPIHAAAHIGDLPIIQCLVEEFRADAIRSYSRFISQQQGTVVQAHTSSSLPIEFIIHHGHISVLVHLAAAFPEHFQNVRSCIACTTCASPCDFSATKCSLLITFHLNTT